jgi:hypothetical protein
MDTTSWFLIGLVVVMLVIALVAPPIDDEDL